MGRIHKRNVSYSSLPYSFLPHLPFTYVVLCSTSWEPRENLDHCEEKLARFYEVMRDSNLDKDWQLQRHLTKEGTEFETRMHRAYHESKLFDSAAYDNCILKKGVSEQQKRDAGKRIEEIRWIDLNAKRKK